MKRIFLSFGVLFLLACGKEDVRLEPQSEQIISVGVTGEGERLFGAFRRIKDGVEPILVEEARGLSFENVNKEALSLIVREKEIFKSYLFSVGFTQRECAEVEAISPMGLLWLSVFKYNHDNRSFQSELRGLTGGEVLDCLSRSAFGVGLAQWGFTKTAVGHTARRLLIRMVGAAAVRAGLGPIGTAIAVAIFVDCIYTANESYTAVFPGDSESTETDTITRGNGETTVLTTGGLPTTEPNNP